MQTQAGEYDPKAEHTDVTYVVDATPTDDLEQFGHYIVHACDQYKTYKLKKISGKSAKYM